MIDETTHDPFAASTPPDIPFARPVGVESPLLIPPAPRCELMLFDLQPRSAWADVGWLVLWVLVLELLIGAVVQILATVVYALPSDGIETADPAIRRVLLFVNLGLRAVCWVGAAFWINRRRGLALPNLGLRGDGRWVDGALGLVTVVGIYAVVIGGVILSQFIWPELYRGFERNAKELTSVLPRLEPLQFGLISLAVGVYEEIVFRGFLLPRLRRALGSWTVAVLFSSAVFTALHMFDQTPAAMILIGFLSITLSVVTILRRSILPAVVAHVLFDFTQFYGLYIQMGDCWK